MFIAHIRSSDQEYQSVKDHLIETCLLAEGFGEKIGMKHLAGLASLLHDVGKYTYEFQEYLLEAVQNPESPPRRGSVDHATAGGKMLHILFNKKENPTTTRLLTEIVGNAIISHHGYLHDYINTKAESNYLDRINKDLEEFDDVMTRFFAEVISKKDFIDYVNKASDELEFFLKNTPDSEKEKSLMFLTKFIFSTLIDADRTNTRLFEDNTELDLYHHEELFSQYYQKLLNKLNTFKSDTQINKLRNEMSQQCDNKASSPSGIYTLSIPTGGGKTLASLRYALKHAQLHNKKRIIYVLPYTTIIEQNANEVREILQDDENILEHHSNVIFDDYDDEHEDGLVNSIQKLKLAKDNWNSPIIFTTIVQFLNVFFAHGNRNTRRLHNLMESVIIFDEVQKVPVKCITLFNQALNFLKRFGNSSILLCTATQPALDFVESSLEVESDAEIIFNIDNVVNAFKRVEILDRTDSGPISTQELADFIISQTDKVKSQLIILNTKTVVRNLYQTLKNEKLTDISIYHLSTSMCGDHRTLLLEEIKDKLQKNEPVICISTQLIEAGVDISFESVIRSLAGLDSIAQAAGRCNRHGEKERGYVYIIDHKEEKLSMLKEIKVGKNNSKKILIDMRNDPLLHGGNILSRQAMMVYFRNFYVELSTEIDYNIKSLKRKMKDLLLIGRNQNELVHAYNRDNQQQLQLFLTQSHKTAAKHFNVIDNLTTSVIVPYGEGENIIAELISSENINHLSSLLKKAQKYTVNLYDKEKHELMKSGGLVFDKVNEVWILKDWAYNDEYGLDLTGEGESVNYIL